MTVLKKLFAVAVLMLTVLSSVTAACSFFTCGPATLLAVVAGATDVVATVPVVLGAACNITGKVESPNARASESEVMPNFFMLYPPCV